MLSGVFTMAQVESPSGDQHEVSNTRAATNIRANIPFQTADESRSDGPCQEDFSGLKGVTCHSTSEILVDSMKLSS